MLNHKGDVAECTGDNIFLVHEGRISTPSSDAAILEGITRNAVIELARGMGIEVREVTLTRYDVYVADECFLTGTAAEVIPVVKVDGRRDRRRQARPDQPRTQDPLPQAGPELTYSPLLMGEGQGVRADVA